uniref:Kelch domain containing 2 n=1 Tax=Seriola lalandi dorsalis TaxID=1841481 RepID=A0A3B4WKU8_SERLL
MAEMEEDIGDLPLLDTEASESFELDTPAERSGHIAVVDRNVMYVWGGYKNAQNHGFFDLYLPRTEIWTYNMETKHIAGGNLHMSMSGSCGVCVDGVLYLFGGHHARGNTNRIYRLPLRATSLVWEEMSDLKGLPPSSKDKLGCWVQKNRLIFFGGYGYAAQGPHQGTFEYDESSSLWDSPGRGWNNHIHILDLETYTWSQPVTTVNTWQLLYRQLCLHTLSANFLHLFNLLFWSLAHQIKFFLISGICESEILDMIFLLLFGMTRFRGTPHHPEQLMPVPQLV